MNEDSRDLIRYYKGKNFVPKSQDILFGRKHTKDEETFVYTYENNTHAPRD
jgi:hypothetical protein